MDIRSLLLPLSGTREGEAGLATALLVARSWNAHLAAVHVRMDARALAALAGESLSSRTLREAAAVTEQETSARLDALRAMFDRLVAEQGVTVSQPAPDGAAASATFRDVSSGEPDYIAQLGRLADLIVVPHPASMEDVSSSNALHALLFDSGRPVLVAPHRPPQEIGRRICLGWNGTAESASAVWFALPWLKRAEAVAILWARQYQRRGPQAGELAAYLARHGVKADMIGFRPAERDVGAGLLAAAYDFGADMLAMGAYSRSRLRQLVLGGVTRHALEKARLPLLMSR